MFRSPYSRMMLVTKAEAAKLPPLYATDGQGGDAVVHVKLFDPSGSYTWYLTELNPDTGEAFGLVVNGDVAELGNINVAELATVRGRFGIGIERDQWFSPTPIRNLREAGEQIPVSAAECFMEPA